MKRDESPRKDAHQPQNALLHLPGGSLSRFKLASEFSQSAPSTEHTMALIPRAPSLLEGLALPGTSKVFLFLMRAA